MPHLRYGRDGGGVHVALGVPEIVSGLHVEPEHRAVAEELAEPDRRLGRYGMPLVDDAVEHLPRDAESLNIYHHAHAMRQEHSFAKDLAKELGLAMYAAS